MKRRARVFAGVILGGSLTILLFSFLAPLTETWGLGVSEKIYGLLRVICHQMPSRCLWYENSNFGLCSHCFGVFLGFAFVAIFILRQSALFKISIFNALLTSLAMFSTLILDVIVEISLKTMAPQSVRVLTGCLAGMGFLFFISVILFKSNKQSVLEVTQ